MHLEKAGDVKAATFTLQGQWRMKSSKNRRQKGQHGKSNTLTYNHLGYDNSTLQGVSFNTPTLAFHCIYEDQFGL